MNVKYMSPFKVSAGEPREPEPKACLRILLAADDRNLRRFTAEFLIDAGYQVDVAEDGATAWAALQLSQFDLLITDQFMLNVSGVELVRKIHEARMTLPILMATAIVPAWEFALHPFLNAVKFIFKPFSFESLLCMVNDLLPQGVHTGDDLTLISLTPEERSAPPLRLFTTVERQPIHEFKY